MLKNVKKYSILFCSVETFVCKENESYCKECCNNCCEEDIKCGDKNEKGKNENVKDVNKKWKGENKREGNWIKFLSGEEIQDESFKFKSCEEFRKASDKNLESHHDYIQVVFPNLERSGYANQDLYLNKNLEKWKELMQDEELRLKIQKNLNLNLIRILKFFGFEVTLGEDSEITKLVAKNDGVAFIPGNHNSLRLTRVLKCLKIFGLDNEYNLIINSINSNKEIMTKINKNLTLKKSYEYWIKSKETNCLFSK